MKSAALQPGYAIWIPCLAACINRNWVILAARPSMGKTALALNIAEHVSVEENTAVLFVSLEMSSIELGDRLLCSASRVNGQRLRDGTISQDDRRKLVEKAAVISNAPLYIDDSPSRTMTEIGATARRLKRKDDLGLIVIDYIQLIEPDNSKDPRQEQVAKIARRLKGMARELEVPVLVPSPTQPASGSVQRQSPSPEPSARILVPSNKMPMW